MNYNDRYYELVASHKQGAPSLTFVKPGDVIVTLLDKHQIEELGEDFAVINTSSGYRNRIPLEWVTAILFGGAEIWRPDPNLVFVNKDERGNTHFFNKELDRCRYRDKFEDGWFDSRECINEIYRLKVKCGELLQ